MDEFVRFSLGGYTSASKEGLKVLGAELEDAFSIFIRYWNQFAAMRADSANKERESSALLNEMFRYPKDKDFIESIIADYPLSAKRSDRSTDGCCKQPDIPLIFCLSDKYRSVLHW